MKFATLPRFQRRMLQTSTSQTTNLPAPATQNASFQTLFKSTTPANVFATLTNFCACHVFCKLSNSLCLPRETNFQPQKTSRAPGVLTILTSESFARAGVVQILGSSTSKSVPNMQRGAFFSYKSLSRAGVVQILSMSTSKSAPNMPVFNDFDFQIALARRRGANFVEINFQKCSEPTVF